MTELSRAYYRERAYQILESREHSTYELRQKLMRRGCPSEMADSISEELSAAGLLDDVRFGIMYMRSKFRQNWSVKRVESELRKKHQIFGETFEQVRQRYAEDCIGDSLESDDERAGRIAERRCHNPGDAEKVFRYLLNHGFSVSCAKRVLQPYR